MLSNPSSDTFYSRGGLSYVTSSGGPVTTESGAPVTAGGAFSKNEGPGITCDSRGWGY